MNQLQINDVGQLAYLLSREAMYLAHPYAQRLEDIDLERNRNQGVYGKGTRIGWMIPDNDLIFEI